MASHHEIQTIISCFKKDLDNGRCTLQMRRKNEQTLGKLGWRDDYALIHLYKNLEPVHYVAGPEKAHMLKGQHVAGSIWIFHMLIEKLDVYIKFHFHKDGTTFISFHESENREGEE